MYFWWPKAFGYQLSETLGKVHFWIILVGFNMTFGPMHILGLQGMPRRTYTYKPGYGFDVWNLVSTLGSYLIAIAVLVFMYNIFTSFRQYRRTGVHASADPWDARSLEWMIPSPAPEHNFDEIPVVNHLDDFWHRKYGEDEQGRAVRIAQTADVVQKGDATDVHLPSPSYWPIVLAFSLPIIAYGVIFNLALSAVGAVILVTAIYAWGFEPSTDDEAHGHDGAHADGHGPDDDGAGAHAGDAVADTDATASDDAPAAPVEEVAPVG
jgi:cytochrome c oxidase subunit 1